MSQAFADKSPAGRLLDLALFAPLGLALSVGEALPELARKGRARLEPQLGVARTVGQLAVGQGKRQLFDLLPFKPGAPGAGLFGARPARPASSSPSVPGPRTVPSASSPVRRPAGGVAGAQRGPAQLAIPSYDALSASQVVQRLAGLSREEVRAVRSYEASTRGRRTILSKADQLLA